MSTPEEKEFRTKLLKETLKDLSNSFDQEIKDQQGKKNGIVDRLKSTKKLSGLNFEEFNSKEEFKSNDVRDVAVAAMTAENMTKRFESDLSESFIEKLAAASKISQELNKKDFKEAEKIFNNEISKQTYKSAESIKPKLPPKPEKNQSNLKNSSYKASENLLQEPKQEKPKVKLKVKKVIKKKPERLSLPESLKEKKSNKSSHAQEATLLTPDERDKKKSKNIAANMRKKLEKAAPSKVTNTVKGIYSAAKRKATSLSK